MFDTETLALTHKHMPKLPLMIAEASLRHDIDELARTALPPMTVAVVDDRFTSEAFGERVWQALRAPFNAVHVTLPGQVRADEQTLRLLQEKTRHCDALAAVGSGTINDLCKYASFLDQKPYLLFPTAASMNGYLSANASMTVNGYKHTLAAHMPEAVFCDLSVIASAPARLSQSGLGDSLARSTAQADWLMSHMLLGTPYNEIPFALLAPLEAPLLEQARGIAKADPQTIALLLKTLLLSGLGMTLAKGSYPASQSEHMLAHAYGMLRGKPDAYDKLHGEEIGVTALMMARIQERMLLDTPRLKPMPFPDQAIAARFGETVAQEAANPYGAKLAAIERAGLDSGMLRQRWDSVCERLAPVLTPSGRILSALAAAQAPDCPEKLGWSDRDTGDALTYARYLRDRFTFLEIE